MRSAHVGHLQWKCFSRFLTSANFSTRTLWKVLNDGNPLIFASLSRTIAINCSLRDSDFLNFRFRIRVILGGGRRADGGMKMTNQYVPSDVPLCYGDVNKFFESSDEEMEEKKKKLPHKIFFPPPLRPPPSELRPPSLRRPPSAV